MHELITLFNYLNGQNERKTETFDLFVAPCEGMRILESGKFCLWNPESWDLESGIQLKDSESHLIQNPSSTPRFLYMGRFLRQLEREQFHAGRLVLKREIPAEFLAYEATLLWP